MPSMDLNPNKVSKIESLILPSTVLIFISIAILLFRVLGSSGPPKNLPLINGTRFYEFTDLVAKKRFLFDGRSLIKKGLAKASIFEIITDAGNLVVLDPKFAHEIRDNPTLNARKEFEKLMYPDISGFEATKELLREDGLLQTAVRTKLLKILWHANTTLSDEATMALQAEWTDNAEWHDISPRRSIPKIIAQVTSRIFLGAPTCRDPEWLHIAVNYTTDLFLTALELRIVPAMLRSAVAQVLPSCRRLRAYLRDSKRIIQPIIDERHQEKDKALREGKEPTRYFDALECFEEAMVGASYNPVHAQLSLTFAAIHTTSDMLTQVLYDLADREELVHALREEIKTVLPQGWNRSTVNQLKLMDSVLKESQRLKPVSFLSMRRLAEEPLQLSDGTVIPKGSRVVVASDRQWDAAYFPDPETFDPYRFLKLCETPGNKAWAQLEGTSPDNLSWGLGRHSCPGRFFAASEIKIVLCHVLMKYDFKIVGKKPRVRTFATALMADPFATLAVRRRREELAL